jgi:hypothetical protein
MAQVVECFPSKCKSQNSIPTSLKLHIHTKGWVAQASMAQAIEHLPSMHEALVSVHSTVQTKTNIYVCVCVC